MLEAALKQKLMQTLTHGHDKGCVWVGWAGSTHTKTFSPVRANFGAASFPDPSVLALDPAVLLYLLFLSVVGRRRTRRKERRRGEEEKSNNPNLKGGEQWKIEYGKCFHRQRNVLGMSKVHSQ